MQAMILDQIVRMDENPSPLKRVDTPTSEFPLGDANTALGELKQGKIRGARVWLCSDLGK